MKSPEKDWVIIYSIVAPYPLQNGAAVRIWEMAQWLRKFYHVGLVMPAANGSNLAPLKNGFDSVWIAYPHAISVRRNLLRRIRYEIISISARRSLSSRYEKELAAFSHKNPLRKIHPPAMLLLDELCTKLRPIAIIAEYVFSAATSTIVARKHGVLSVIDTIDVLSQRQKSERAAGVPQQRGKFSEKHEIELLSLADALIAIQPNEAKLLADMLPEKQIILAEHPVVVNEYPSTTTNNNYILFVSSQARHNIHALRIFIERQWPIIRKTVPEAELHICGNVSRHFSEVITQENAVFFHGFCPDIASYYQKATIAINPVNYGSGLKIKSVEALAYGKCLVSTPIGADGLEEHAGRAFVCVEVDQMHQAIIELLRDPHRRQMLETEALNLAKQRFSPEVCFYELTQLLEITSRNQQN
ncbi:glycosyltransferase family 4 protein [Microcoleus sp. FACHB-68]|uniref:glycosyltransferase family 4 protein n=1 Tax=Microcoleus sp. FACHB-68 TaxID=2692826 RepID=UPI00168977D7|nr:glycosyltransferase family 4 protein [Microcoleus sp. FACHB-68]MBD1936513.1 glycosyltransferase family 4 protein [Microcoleus sp. FACHB-68]